MDKDTLFSEFAAERINKLINSSPRSPTPAELAACILETEKDYFAAAMHRIMNEGTVGAVTGGLAALIADDEGEPEVEVLPEEIQGPRQLVNFEHMIIHCMAQLGFEYMDMPQDPTQDVLALRFCGPCPTAPVNMVTTVAISGLEEIQNNHSIESARNLVEARCRQAIRGE